MKKNAFTLAEVLLTLAIIGVVAALTIPAVITKVTKDQYVVGLKKAYNTLKAVQREAEQEHGPMENWSWTSGTDPVIDFEKYFLPYFDVLKNCKKTETGCFSATITDIWTDDEPRSFDSGNTDYKILSSDGMSWAYWKMPGTPIPPAKQSGFYVDVNGLKGPNRQGRDIFEFDVFPSNLGIKPRGSYSANGTGTSMGSIFADADCDPDGGTVGMFCAAKVLSEGAMNY